MEKSFTQKGIDRNMERLRKNFPHLNKFPFEWKGRGLEGEKSTVEGIAKLYDKLAYPEHPNWTYCIPLIPNVEIDGEIVDIGFHMNDDWISKGEVERGFSIVDCMSANIVYSNEGQDYQSGPLGIGTIRKKKLVMALYNLEIISREHLGELILDFNGFMMNFFKSELVGYDLEDFVKGNVKENINQKI
tara:strand:- start:163 stop:726 length:564 start_codon:yes stop_codon:yes gene_type:complete